MGKCVAMLRFQRVTNGRPPRTGLQNRGNTMERVTLRIPKQQIEEVEHLVDSGEYPNRSEAIRSAVREKLAEQETGTERPSEKRGRENSQRKDRTWARV